MATRFPLLTGLAIVIGGFFIFAIISIANRAIVDPDHVVLTSYQASGDSDDGKVAVTINRVSHHPATNVRGIFSRQADSTARPEYIQVDGTVGLSADSSTEMVLLGSALIVGEDGVQVEREIRTRGNTCLTSGWHPMAFQIKTKPGNFSIRIPVKNSPVAARVLESIENGDMPDINIRGIYSTNSECESLEVIRAGVPHEIGVESISIGAGVTQDFYPYGEPRFDVEVGEDDQLWREWARGWVPGEF